MHQRNRSTLTNPFPGIIVVCRSFEQGEKYCSGQLKNLTQPPVGIVTRTFHQSQKLQVSAGQAIVLQERSL